MRVKARNKETEGQEFKNKTKPQNSWSELMRQKGRSLQTQPEDQNQQKAKDKVKELER